MTGVAPPAQQRPSQRIGLVKLLVVNAVAVSIAGVAAAVFSNQIFALVGYALLGLASCALWLWGSVNLELFEKMQKAMDQDVVSMNLANEKTAELTRKLSEEDATLREYTASLRSQVEALRGQNGELRQSLKGMEEEMKRLWKNNRELDFAKTELEQSLANLAKSSGAIQREVREFLSLNLEMGRTVGAFEAAGTGLGETRESLQNAVAELAKMGGDIAHLSSQIELGRKSVGQLLDLLMQQREQEKKQGARLSALVETLQAERTALSAQNASLESQVKSWTGKAQTVDRTSLEMAETAARIAKSQEAIQRAIKELSAKREALAEENRKLVEKEETVMANLKGIDERIAFKQKQLQELNAQIREKIEQLKTLKKEVALLQ